MKGRTETTDAAPRPDVPIAVLGWRTPRVSPDLPREIPTKGQGWTRAKRVGQYTLDGVLIDIFPSAQDAANAMKTSPPSISKVARGEQKSAKGYGWRYIDEGVAPC